ncbi:MAG: sodium:solute symporter family protein [Bacillota bacterium]
MSLFTITWAITIVFCLIFLWIAWRVKDEAGKSFTAYAIAGGTLPFILVMFTDMSTIMGAGNFMGHAANGFKIGYSQIYFVLGEQGSKIIFALVFAGFAGRFIYRSIAEMMDDLLFRDKISRGIVGLLTVCIMTAWIGGQGMGLGYIFKQFTGADPTVIILFFSAIFILYTYLGGMHGVVWTEFLQGIMIAVFGVVFYLAAFAPVHFSITELNAKLAQAGAANLTNFTFNSKALNNFITGCFGILAAQVYWQRCFASKDGATARNGMLVAGTFAVVTVSLTVLVGMVTKALNPAIDPNMAMPWLMTSQVPLAVTAIVFTLILAAAISSAASNLNSAAVILVNDLIVPFNDRISDSTLVNIAKGSTVLVGAFAALAAMYSPSIIGLFSKAYTMAGGSVVPVLLVGLLWKRDYGRPFETGARHNSQLTPWGARTGLVAGAVISLAYGILWGIPVAAALAIIVSLLTRSQLAAIDEARADA